MKSVPIPFIWLVIRMRNWKLGALLVFFCCLGTASATPCGAGSIGTYIGLGATGCTVGPYTFHDFGFSVFSSTGGPAVLGTADLTVTPVSGASKYGLNFAGTGGPGFSLSSGQAVDYLLTYTVDPPPPIIWGFEMDMFTNTPVAPGFANITSSECVGAAFVGVTCGTFTVGNQVFHNGGTSFQLTDIQAIPGIDVIGTRTHIVLDATAGGSSSFTSFTQLTMVPEPGTLLTGLVAFGVLFRRRS